MALTNELVQSIEQLSDIRHTYGLDLPAARELCNNEASDPNDRHWGAMRYDQLDLNLLVALDALLELRSVSASAIRLNLSQPAMSGALQRLRAYFDDPLLLQSGRRLLLTPKSEQLVAPVRRALLQIRLEITRPSGFDPATATRRFAIVASDYAITLLVADLMSDVSRLAPNVSFEIVPPDDHAVERLERAEVDLFFTVNHISIAGHPLQELWQDDEVVISWSESAHDKVDEEDFFNAGHAVAFFGPGRGLGLTERLLGERALDRRVEVLLPNFNGLPQAVVGTQRLASMHRKFAEHFAQFYPIKLHAYPFSIPPFVEVMQWHKARETDQGVVWLRNLVEQKCAELAARAP